MAIHAPIPDLVMSNPALDLNILTPMDMEDDPGPQIFSLSLEGSPAE